MQSNQMRAVYLVMLESYRCERGRWARRPAAAGAAAPGRLRREERLRGCLEGERISCECVPPLPRAGGSGRFAGDREHHLRRGCRVNEPALAFMYSESFDGAIRY